MTTVQLLLTEEARAKAKATRKAKIAAGVGLRHNFLDLPEWRLLAKGAQIRLPHRYLRPDEASMKSWLRKMGLSVAWYRTWSGYSRLGEWLMANPDWPLYAFVGLVLEARSSVPACETDDSPPE